VRIVLAYCCFSDHFCSHYSHIIVFLFSDSEDNLDAALAHLRSLRDRGMLVSAASLNAIMSACAERGNVDFTFEVMDEFRRNNVEPNADAISFAFEALGKNLYRRRHRPSELHFTWVLGKADLLLTFMEEKGIAPTHHIIREYVELLCQAKEVRLATDVIHDMIANDGLVNNKTVYRVAMANAECGDFEVARKIAGLASEPLPYLLQNIKREELKAQHHQNMMIQEEPIGQHAERFPATIHNHRRGAATSEAQPAGPSERPLRS
jgi:pentatricopeptide repeat protein